MNTLYVPSSKIYFLPTDSFSYSGSPIVYEDLNYHGLYRYYYRLIVIVA